MARAGAIVIKNGKIALIKRVREGMVYYIVPGGQIEYSESTEEACIREIKEELGYDIIPKEMVVDVVFNDNHQYYFTCEIIGGEFGTGNGLEFDPNNNFPPERGTYEPVWIDINEFDNYDIRPIEMKAYFMKINIREIEEKDYLAVKALLVNDLWNDSTNGDNVIPFFDKVKNDDTYITFVAVSDNIVVGMVSAIKFSWAWSEKNHIYIQGFVVKSEHLNKGIGTKLLTHLEDYAKAHNVMGIGLCSGFQRTDAHAFYEKNGYGKITQYFGKNFT
jgi:ADP-ribose pyrophosphatase